MREIARIQSFPDDFVFPYNSISNAYKVIGYSRNPDKAAASIANIDFIPGLTPVLLDRYMVHTVVHLAGIAHDLSGHFSQEDFLKVNYKWTCELFDAIQKSSVKNFVFLSSIKAVTEQSDKIIDENYVPDPKSDYGVSKRLAEQYILKNSDGKTSIFILRPCMIHGSGNKGNLNTLHQFISKGIPYPLAAFDNKRSYLSIDNFSFVIESILNGKLQSGDYLLADSESISTKELVRMIAESNGRKLRQLAMPKVIVRMMARMGSLFNVPFNTQSLIKLTGNMEVSNKKLLTALGCELPVSAREGLMKTISSLDE